LTPSPTESRPPGASVGAVRRARATPHWVGMALRGRPANGTTLNPGQAALVTQMATSGARLQLAIAPAGTGKTTAMRALAAAWTEDGGTVIGLAPSAAAAAVLREQTGAVTDTLAKLTWSINHDLPDWANTIGFRTLVVIDAIGALGPIRAPGVGAEPAWRPQWTHRTGRQSTSVIPREQALSAGGRS